MAALVDYSIELLAGSTASAVAPIFWRELGKNRRAILWDVPESRRKGYLFLNWLNADIVGIAWHKAIPCAAAWLVPAGPNSRCGLIHFAFTPQAAKAAKHIGAAFHASLARMGKYDSLLGLIPKPFRHALALVHDLGYTAGPVLPGACFLDDHNKIADGIIVTKILEQAYAS